MSQSKKARAFLIALVNLNIIIALASFSAIDPTVSAMAIQAIMVLAGLYVGAQGSIDFAAAWKGDASYKKTIDEKIVKDISVEKKG